MINLDSFKKKDKEPREEKLIFRGVYLDPKNSDFVDRFSEKQSLSYSQTLRYFIILGIQAHQKRNKLKKRYESIIEEDMLREAIIEEYHRRAAAEE